MKCFPFWHSIVRKTAKKWKVARLYEILNAILSQSDHVNLLHCTTLLVPSYFTCTILTVDYQVHTR